MLATRMAEAWERRSDSGGVALTERTDKATYDELCLSAIAICSDLTPDSEELTILMCSTALPPTVAPYNCNTASCQA